MQISDEQFGDLINQAVAQTPEPYKSRLVNVVFLAEDDPSPEQRVQLQLRGDQSLLGLYEGVPLPRRGGATKLLPDKITLFKNPLLGISQDLPTLKRNVGHTVWHEVAHYFGLDHEQIYKLDSKPNNKHKK